MLLTESFSPKKIKKALLALQSNNIVPAFLKKKRKFAKDLHALQVLNKHCSYISHDITFRTILGF